MEWIFDELPEDNKMLIVYDYTSGLNFAYYDAMEQKFFKLYSDSVLDCVCAWIYAPEKPERFGTVLDRVRGRHIMRRIYCFK